MPNSVKGGKPPPSSSPLTVLFAPAHTLVDDAQGGSEYHWPYKLIERLALDHGVRVIALTVQSRIQHQLPGVQFVPVGPSRSLPASNLERLRFHLRVYATARKILASGQPIDVVHHMLPFGLRATFNLLALDRRRTDPPLVIGPLQPPLAFNAGDELLVSLRDFSAVENPPPSPPSRHNTLPPLSTCATMPVLSTLSRATLRRASALVAISEGAAQLYRSFAGTGNLTVIPPGVDTSEFTPMSSNESTGGETDKRRVEIIAVGYLMQRKAFDVLIKAVGKLTEASIPLHLRIVGDGPARASLESLVHQLGLEHVVTFAGFVPHSSIVNEYHKADILCSMSLSESFSVVGLEAMACGLPVVATPTGFFREVLRQHHVGMVVRFGDVDQLASALVRIVTNPSLRQELGRQARALVLEEYDWSLIARRYLSLYNQLLHQKK